jgi:signal recognition particle receptor subunit alpha
MSGVKSEVNAALSAAITRVLTPKTSTNILLDIKRKSTQSTAPALTTSDAPIKKDPYSMTFVGVNGVGKSTNLSKVCFWLLQNQLRVLIAACDTFRSGAVEQLRVHVRNLGMLGDQLGGEAGILGGNKVELYERGYGKDAAGIAKDAIAYGEFVTVFRGPAFEWFVDMASLSHLKLKRMASTWS